MYLVSMQRLLFVFFLVSLSVMLWFPPTYAYRGQLKVGDQWTVSGTYENALTGSGKYQGKYNETGPWSEEFSVASVSNSTLTISAVYQYTSSEVSSGYFSSYATRNGQHSYTYLYVINETSLIFISSSDAPNRAGHPNWLLVNTSLLVAGGSVPLTWRTPSPGGKGQATVTDVPWKVMGNQQMTLGSVNLQVWGIGYSGNSEGSWSETSSGSGLPVYAVGPETEVIYYDSVYALFVGTSVSGTYHLNADGGAWNETDMIKGQISSSNIILGPLFPAFGTGVIDFSILTAALPFINRKHTSASEGSLITTGLFHWHV